MSTATRDGRVAVVVLHHGRWPAVLTTVAAAREQAEAAGADLLVVDNGSPGSIGAQLAAALPDSEVLQVTRNDGYGAGMNVALRLLSSRGVSRAVLLTHEVIVSPGGVATLLAHLGDHPEVALAGPLLVRAGDPTRVWSAGGLRARSGRLSHALQDADTTAVPPGPVAVDWLDGAALAVRVSDVLRAGGFDESFFLYGEDVDLSLRLRKRGMGVQLVPGVSAEQDTDLVPPYLLGRNGLLLARAHGGRMPFLAGTLLRAGRDAARGNRSAAGLRLAGLADGLRGRLDRSRATLRPA